MDDLKKPLSYSPLLGDPFKLVLLDEDVTASVALSHLSLRALRETGLAAGLPNCLAFCL